jgi:hypothetical protein
VTGVEKENQMSGTQNTNTTLTGDTSEQTIGVRKAAQLLAVAVLAALFAIPVASATETTQPWQPVQTKQPAHALVIRGQALNRIYHLGSYARTSPAKASTVLKPTAVKITANPTGGSANTVQHVFSIH